MLVTPAATASLLTHRLWQGMIVSAAIGALSAVIGLYLSYYFNIVSGSAIVLTATLIFLFVFLLHPHRRGVEEKIRMLRK
jgi:ABC-type Mn2+/Zn2+ transport system permease subunit